MCRRGRTRPALETASLPATPRRYEKTVDLAGHAFYYAFMHNSAEKIRPTSELVRDLRLFCQGNNLTQSALAEACGINQSQVSRLLRGEARTLTKALRALCIYASIPIKTNVAYDPTNDVRLMGALRAAVGNSLARARQLERLMTVLAED